MEYLTCPFEVKAGSEDGYITGYGSVFGNVDSYGDIAAKGDAPHSKFAKRYATPFCSVSRCPRLLGVSRC